MERYKGQGGIGGRAPPGENVECCAPARPPVCWLIHIICNHRKCFIIVFSMYKPIDNPSGAVYNLDKIKRSEDAKAPALDQSNRGKPPPDTTTG